MAGLLHDIGLLVLNTNFPDRYREVFRLIKDDGRRMLQAEREVFGATHADVGAYLLGIWGLHEVIVEAVAFHHEPLPTTQDNSRVLAAVHVANVLDEEADRAVTGGIASEISIEYLTGRHLDGEFRHGGKPIVNRHHPTAVRSSNHRLLRLHAATATPFLSLPYSNTQL